MLHKKVLLKMFGLISVARNEMAKNNDETGLEDCRRIMSDLEAEINFPPDDGWILETVKLIYQAQGKIPAVRLFRRLSGVSLVEARQWVEDNADTHCWVRPNRSNVT